MKFLRAMLPNLTIALNISLLVVVYLDQRNPMMGCLMGTPFLTLAALCALCSIVSAGLLYGDWRKSGRYARRMEHNEEKNEKNAEITLDI
jgi:hypothetical protein